MKPSVGLRGCCIDINDCIDCIIGCLGCFAKGETVITGAEVARQKECDRISAMAAELSKMGLILSASGWFSNPAINIAGRCGTQSLGSSCGDGISGCRVGFLG